MNSALVLPIIPIIKATLSRHKKLSVPNGLLPVHYIDPTSGELRSATRARAAILTVTFLLIFGLGIAAKQTLYPGHVRTSMENPTGSAQKRKSPKGSQEAGAVLPAAGASCGSGTVTPKIIADLVHFLWY